MHARQHFPAAPWTNTLKFISLSATALLLFVGIAAWRKFSLFSGFPLVFGIGIVSVFPAIPIFSILFMVTGYGVEGKVLFVERLFWSTPVSLEGLRKVWAEPGLCRGSIRIFGNAGLYSFTGLYYKAALGRYRLFATDLSKATVLELPSRKVVITPATPQVFIDYLHSRFFLGDSPS